MSSKSLVLSKHHITHISKQLLRPLSCDWVGCKVVLNSWSNLQQHLLRHCHQAHVQDYLYTCGLPRCSGRDHKSVGMLQNHVELSHLPRIHLTCPARGCTETFNRITALEAHFMLNHPQLVDTPISFPSPDIDPTNIPFAPTVSPPKMSLPDGEEPIHLMFPLVLPGSRKRKNSPLPISRKWSKLDMADEDEHESIQFDDLPPYRARTGSPLRRVTLDVQPSPPGLHRQLSRPQPLVESPPFPGVAPRSMLFDELVRKSGIDIAEILADLADGK